MNRLTKPSAHTVRGIAGVATGIFSAPGWREGWVDMRGASKKKWLSGPATEGPPALAQRPSPGRSQQPAVAGEV
ncbi:hypothetical protein NH8B_3776 [Pseudogulbenkiania sp. NH8B]|nr:hypothetical protein NH8B_3776 [Pseudogulbenkiania sp. NH8B]